MKKRLAVILLSAVGLMPPAHAQSVGTVESAYAPSLHAFSPDGSPMGQIPASDLIGQPVMGIDDATGLLKVQTQKGLILVKPAAVKTTMKAAAPKETACGYMQSMSPGGSGSVNGVAEPCQQGH